VLSDEEEIVFYESYENLIDEDEIDIPPDFEEMEN